MNIYEKIFARLEEINMSQIELSRRTGIATSTISDWRKKQINPQADKLVAICKALDMSLVDLLCDEEDKKNEFSRADYVVGEQFIIDSIKMSSGEMKRRVFSYLERWIRKQEIKLPTGNIPSYQMQKGKKLLLLTILDLREAKMLTGIW